jgi:tRNA-guanine family transglycosylase
VHNLYFIQRLMARIRAAVRADALSALREEFLSRYVLA